MKKQKTRGKIPIPDSVFLRWKELYQHGDMAEIEKQYGKKLGVTRYMLSTTWTSRMATENVRNAFGLFYQERESRINESEKQLVNA